MRFATILKEILSWRKFKNCNKGTSKAQIPRMNHSLLRMREEGKRLKPQPKQWVTQKVAPRHSVKTNTR
jgi:hypothetical protein